MIKRFLTITMACFFLVACKGEKTSIVTDCSSISDEAAQRMETHYLNCKLSNPSSTRLSLNCENGLEDLFCEKIIIEYNNDYTVKSVRKLLTGEEINFGEE